jgi:hypothetical protein
VYVVVVEVDLFSLSQLFGDFSNVPNNVDLLGL